MLEWSDPKSNLHYKFCALMSFVTIKTHEFQFIYISIMFISYLIKIGPVVLKFKLRTDRHKLMGNM
jgi:hypothetical protein